MKKVNKRNIIPILKLKTSVSYLSLAVATFLLPCAVTNADVGGKKIGDLEIYFVPKVGNPNILLVLDNSNSMAGFTMPGDNPGLCSVYTDNNGIPVNYIAQQWVTKGINVYKDDGSIGDSNFTYSVAGCPGKDSSGYFKNTLLNSDGSLDPTATLDRATKVKLAIIPMLADPKTYFGDKYLNYNMGLSEFFQRAGPTNASGAEIITPVQAITYEQRKAMLDRLRWFQGWVNATSTANAYAEAGAYMMGTKTASPDKTSTLYEIAGYYDPANQQLVRCQPFQITSRVGSLPPSFNFCNNILDSGLNMQTTNIVNNVTSLADAKAKAPTALGIFNSDMTVQPYTYTGTTTTVPHSFTYANGGSSTVLALSPSLTYTKGNTYYYFARKLNPTATTDRFSGVDLSNVTTQDPTTNKYKTPIPLASTMDAQCAGNGIYFLTDGVPAGNYGGNDWSQQYAIPLMMRNALDNPTGTAAGKVAFSTGNTCRTTNNLPAVTSDSLNPFDQWQCIGEFSQTMRNLGNPSSQRIYTAAVGFGRDFSAFATVVPVEKTIKIDGVNKTKKVYNCDAVTSAPHARNLCKLSEYGYGFGEGGFTYTSTTAGVVESLKTFVASLGGEINPIPSSTITIPDDPYRVDSQMATAYLPTMLAQPDTTNAVWQGNVKKYNLNEGTLYGNNNAKLFKDALGNLNGNTEDLWTAAGQGVSGNNNDPQVGGMYANLKTPKSGVSSVRTVWVEDVTSSSNSTPILRQVGVGTDGKPTGFDALVDPVYTQEVQRRLLSFLGFDNIPTNSVDGALVPTYADVKDMTLTAPTNEVKVLGGIVHSAPTVVSYSATLDANGRVGTTRDDYALFGSMDGALHLVSSADGKETFAVIPKAMLVNQSEALQKDAASSITTVIGRPDFGVDAPWLVTTDYKYSLNDSSTTASTNSAGKVEVDNATGKGVFAYGGLRMGGEAIYGMNLTSKTAPTILFSITPNTAGFERMGQIWSKPTKAKIKTSASDTGTDVLVFTGGYDTCYEDDAYQVGTTTSTLINQRGQACNRTSNTAAIGNAVYIVNAQTGALIWSASAPTSSATSATGSFTPVANMTNSIVGSVTTLDRNNDGFMDHIYFADLGGQVFRADFTNAGDKTYTVDTGSTSINTQAGFSNQRVTRILANRYTGANTKYNIRFYERPVVSFYRNPTTSNLFALINVISGDRSSPLSELRADNQYADRLYGLIDTDVTKVDSTFFASNFTDSTNTAGQSVADVTDTNLLALPSADITATSTDTAITTAKNAQLTILRNGQQTTGTTTTKIYGWYYPLTRFDGYANVPYGKGIGKSEVVGSYLYTTVYNPKMNYGVLTDACTAKIKGGSERELYCLPYGICSDTTSKTGTGGFVRAGVGIQELTLGPRSSTLSNQKLLIGTQTLTERASTRYSFNSDLGKKLATDTGANSVGLSDVASATNSLGDGSAAEIIFNERYTLKPTTWYEVN